MKKKSNLKVKSVSWGRTKNVGNYQSERADVTVELGPGDSVHEAFELAEREVSLKLDGPKKCPTCRQNCSPHWK